MKLLCYSLLLTLAGCATELSPQGARIRLATADEVARCKSLGIFTTEARTGPNKSGNAMNQALNEAASRGADALYLVSSHLDWAEGASVTGEALKCAMDGPK